MKQILKERAGRQGVDLDAAAAMIALCQLSSGEIPWHSGGKTDPWDHVESAMGLTVAGRYAAARHAFTWLRERQLSDGSWFSAYRQGLPTDRTRESNFAAYAAVGLYHHYLATEDGAFLADAWPMLQRAIDFAVGLQSGHGEIYWAISPAGRIDATALLTGSSSVYMSLKCAVAAAEVLGRDASRWRCALTRLREAIADRPQRFNMTKSRFSMDWFYPVLCGAVNGDAARRRIDRYWKKFVIDGQGVRCVSDQPWVTIAESSELVLALCAMGHRGQARLVFDWISDKKFADGAYWCGHTCPDMVVWPEEKMSWTSAAVLLAADALYGLSPAGRLFDHRYWEEMGIG